MSLSPEGRIPFPYEEPTAAMRETARMFRDMFVALVKEGFTEAQALTLIGTAISAAIQNPNPPAKDDD